MARMIPSVLSPDTKSRAEKKLYHELRRALSDAFTVFHSFGIIERRREMGSIDREIDFLIVSRRGLIALEAKGGKIAYKGMEGKWRQNDHEMKRSPFEQAKDNKYAVRDFLNSRIPNTSRMTIGHAVIFPDVFADMEELPAEASTEILINGYELATLSDKINAIIEYCTEKWHRPLTEKEYGQVLKVLAPEFEYGGSLVDRLKAAEQQIFRLSEEQCDILSYLCEQKKVLIKGCAGSGKTVLAVKKAREFASDGGRVLFLCFNKLLARMLKDSIGEGYEKITVTNYQNFFMSTLEQAGIRPEVPGPIKEAQRFWDEGLPDVFDQWLDRHPLLFDAIIIDEGQDIKVGYWLVIEKMLRKEGSFYIFYDPDQNLYGTNLQFPIENPPIVLSGNYRNTVQICNELRRHTSQRMTPLEEAPEGEPIKEVHCKSDRDLRKALGQSLHALIVEGGLARENAVILGGHNIRNSCLAHDPKIGNFTIRERPDPDESDPEVIAYYTYMGFKGLEADAVILLGVNPKDRSWSNANALYTAMSRAKFVLHVLWRDD